MPSLVSRYSSSGLLDVDVYEVDHHGSRNGVSDGLLSAISPEMAVLSMGPADRQLPWTAWAYGHPNKDTVELLEQHVSGTRTGVAHPLGNGAKTFSANQVITKAIYGTGWDGTVVVSAKSDGYVHVVQ